MIFECLNKYDNDNANLEYGLPSEVNLDNFQVKLLDERLFC